MNRINTIILVSIAFVLGQLIIPPVFGLLFIPIWITSIVSFIFIMPIPILMIRDLKGIPYVRIISYGVLFIPICGLLIDLTANTSLSAIGGYALLYKLGALISVFAVGFVVYHYLNFSKRGAVFIIIFAVLSYLEPILGSFTFLVNLFFGVLQDYSDNNIVGVYWNISGPMGLTTIYTYVLKILTFVSLVISFDGLMQEKKLSNY